MQTISRIFFDSIAGLAGIAVWMQWREYRKLTKGEKIFAKAKDATDFVTYSSISLWWLLGCFVIDFFYLSPFWIFGWFVLGCIALFIVTRLVEVSGLELFIAIGESGIRKMAEVTAAAEMNQHDASPSEKTEPIQPFPVPPFLPDLGKYLATIGRPQQTMFFYTSWQMDAFQVISLGRYCTTQTQSHDGKMYCGTFDFGDGVLNDFLNVATFETRRYIDRKLSEDPSSARTMVLPNPIHIGIAATLGSRQRGLHDTFIPLVIMEVIGAKKR